jgi:hypothetical protein
MLGPAAGPDVFASGLDCASLMIMLAITDKQYNAN